MRQLDKDLKIIHENNEAFKRLQGEHVADELDLDMSLEEHLLQMRDPDGYSLNVDGVRIIHIKDEDVETRYLWRDGNVIRIKGEIF